MNSNHKANGNSALIRIGGAAILIGLSIHIYVNMFVKQFPPENPTLQELKAYLVAEADTWALVHGLRYVAFLCIALFAAGVFARTSCSNLSHINGWGVVGLLGSAMLLINALITNGIEILTFLDFERLSEEPKLFWLLFHLTRVLWTAEMAAWSILILGFSVAGWQTSSVPRLLSGLGMIAATSCLLSSAFVVSILRDGDAVVFIEVGSLAGLVWFLLLGIYMMVIGARYRFGANPKQESV